MHQIPNKMSVVVIKSDVLSDNLLQIDDNKCR